jgi:hypothetical protein
LTAFSGAISVAVAGLEKVYSITAHQIDDTVLLR